MGILTSGCWDELPDWPLGVAADRAPVVAASAAANWEAVIGWLDVCIYRNNK